MVAKQDWKKTDCDIVFWVVPDVDGRENYVSQNKTGRKQIATGIIKYENDNNTNGFVAKQDWKKTDCDTLFACSCSFQLAIHTGRKTRLEENRLRLSIAACFVIFRSLRRKTRLEENRLRLKIGVEFAVATALSTGSRKTRLEENRLRLISCTLVSSCSAMYLVAKQDWKKTDCDVVDI